MKRIESRITNAADLLGGKVADFASKHFGRYTFEDQTSPEVKAAIAKAQAEMPTYEQVHAALPSELRPEFESLGQTIVEINDSIGIVEPGRGVVVHDEDLSDEGRQVYDRYGELYSFGRKAIESSRKPSQR